MTDSHLRDIAQELRAEAERLNGVYGLNNGFSHRLSEIAHRLEHLGDGLPERNGSRIDHGPKLWGDGGGAKS